MSKLSLIPALLKTKLPAAILRGMYGSKLPVVDGRQADPKAQAVADLVALVRDPTKPPSVEESRVQMAGFVDRFDRKEAGVTRQDMDLPGATGPRPARRYRPLDVAADKVLPTLFYLHGGGWVQGGIATHDDLCAKLARRAGIQVISFSYRLAPEHPYPAAPDDVMAGYQGMLAQIDALAIDRERIAVGGDSAGGNLAASLIYSLAQLGQPLPQAQLLLYPALDGRLNSPSVQALADHPLLSRARMQGYFDLYMGSHEDRLEPRVSPLMVPDLAGQSPAFVLVAGHDPLWDDGQAYAARLKDAGVSVALAAFEGQVHGFLNLTKVIPQADEAIDLSAKWLRQTLAG